MNINTTGFMLFIAAVATILLTFLAYKYIIPEGRKTKLNKLGQFISDIFNFKFLIIEKILQFFYVLSTIACICGGLSMLLGIRVYYSAYSERLYSDWYGIYGLLIAILGPIVIRLTFEGIMMALLLVKNVMQINKKLKSQAEDEEYQMPTFKELVAKENFDFIKKQPEQVDEQAQ